jgi:hypothetical protein
MKYTYHAQSEDHTAPEQNVVQQCPALHPLASLHHDYWHLKHHGKKPVSSKLPCDAAHHQFMCECRYEKGDKGSERARQMILGGRVDVSTEEMMNWYIPLFEVSINP